MNPADLEEEEIDKRDEARKVLPPRNPSQISRTQVQRDSPSPNVVDQATVATCCEPSANQDMTSPHQNTLPHQNASPYSHTIPRDPSASATPPKARSRTKPVFSKLPPVSIVGAH